MSALTRPLSFLWNYTAWDRLVGTGVLEGHRVELIGGEIIDKGRQTELHVAAIIFADRVMRSVFGERAYCVRLQAPLRLGHDSDPEPDVAIVKGPMDAYLESGHPKTARLVIEAAQASLDFDRADKASLYAGAGIADYWIVNLIDNQLEVHRKPIAYATERFGHRYSKVTILKSGESIAPLAAKENPWPSRICFHRTVL